MVPQYNHPTKITYRTQGGDFRLPLPYKRNDQLTKLDKILSQLPAMLELYHHWALLHMLPHPANQPEDWGIGKFIKSPTEMY